MKNATLGEFRTCLDEIVSEITQIGEIYRVDAGKSGAFVVMEEDEYKILRDALKNMLQQP